MVRPASELGAYVFELQGILGAVVGIEGGSSTIDSSHADIR